MVIRKEYEERFRGVIKKFKDENVDLFILDEIMVVINLKLVFLDEVIEFFKNKLNGLEVVLIGRNLDKKLIDIVNYVLEIKVVKYLYE